MNMLHDVLMRHVVLHGPGELLGIYLCHPAGVGFDMRQIGKIALVWGLAYGAFNFPAGGSRRLGPRCGMVVALGWSVFMIATPLASSLGGGAQYVRWGR